MNDLCNKLQQKLPDLIMDPTIAGEPQTAGMVVLGVFLSSVLAGRIWGRKITFWKRILPPATFDRFRKKKSEKHK